MTSVRDNEITGKKNIICHLFLIVAPWLVFWAQDSFYPHLLRLIDPAIRPPLFISYAPLEILLIIGIIIAWKRDFPLWSYTWIGILYFFGYRVVFYDVVFKLAPLIMPESSDFIVHGFYAILNPLALAVLLFLITRRDWLLGCLTAYPFTSIIMAWYTLDRTPFPVYLISLVLYVFFAFLFLVLQSRTLKFVGLLAGTLIISGGFFLYYGSFQSLLFVVGRNVLILVFSLIVRSFINRFAQREK